jgi:syntaxin 17
MIHEIKNESDCKNIENKFEQLEKDLNDITALFREVNTMVSEHSQYIDSIENSLNTIKEDTKIATNDLTIAKTYKTTLPIVGAVFGGIIGGPLGIVAGSKAGIIGIGICGGFSTIVGSLTGYYLCK